MKAGDLVRPCLDYAQASIADPRHQGLVFGFVMCPSDTALVLNPMDRGVYTRALMRGTIVWVSENAMQVISEAG